MSLLNDYIRVSRKHPCPVCGKPDWCMISRDDPANPSKALCKRVEFPIKWRDAGWLHKLRDDHGLGRGGSA